MPRRVGLHLVAIVATATAAGVCSRMEIESLPLLAIFLVPWLAAIDRTETARGALASGATMAAAFSWVVLGWLANAIETYTGAPRPLSVVCVLLLSPILEPQMIVFALFRFALRRRRAVRIVGAAGAYVGTEWLLGKALGDTLGLGFYPSTALRQAADLSGLSGLTLAVLLINECALVVAETAFARRSTRGARQALLAATAATLMVGGLSLYGTRRTAELARERAGRDPLRAAVIQANIAGYDTLAAELGTYEAVRRILDAHFELSLAALRRSSLNLIVWPESVYPTTFGSPKSPEGAEFDRIITALPLTAQLPLVFGSYDAAGGAEYNAAIFLVPQPNGDPQVEVYRKAHPFPFTEWVPGLFDTEWLRSRLPWLGTWKRGDGPHVLELQLTAGERLRVAPVICYDAIYPEHTATAARNGAEVILTLSNDSWFGSSEGARLHLIVSTFRSIETRRPQIRATNTGISAFIDSAGTLTQTAGIGERVALIGQVSPAHGNSGFVRWGNWIGTLGLAVAVLLIVVSHLRRADQ